LREKQLREGECLLKWGCSGGWSVGEGRRAGLDAGGEETEVSGGTTPVGRITEREKVWRVAVLGEGEEDLPD